MLHMEELAGLIEAKTCTRSSGELLESLTSAGIPAGPIYDVAQMLDDPQAKARGMVVETQHPVFGSLLTIGNPVKLSETPWALRRVAPRLGDHTAEVLSELGYSQSEMAGLHAQGIIELRE